MIWTVGHSTRPIEELLTILAAGGIKLLADVRRFPGSRRHPQFGQEALDTSLAKAGIAYCHFIGLGGRRSQRLPDSPNTAWRVEQFNAYADYMQSDEFLTALEELMAAARKSPTAIMCSEALPQKCHRRLIADGAGGPRLDRPAPSLCQADRGSYAHAVRPRGRNGGHLSRRNTVLKG